MGVPWMDRRYSKVKSSGQISYTLQVYEVTNTTNQSNFPGVTHLHWHEESAFPNKRVLLI